MSTEFSPIGDLRVAGDYQDSDEAIRSKSVEAALVLMNSRIAACENVHAINEALKPGTISKLADRIEEALKNTK